MSPKLRPLMLPAMVQQKRQQEAADAAMTTSVCEGDLLNNSYYSTRNSSSSSDIASPVTPTFSTRHLRYSSSTSSLELPAYLPDLPVSPMQAQYPCKPPQSLQQLHQLPQTAAKPGKRSLPDVEEEPFERIDYDDGDAPASPFGLYSCICDHPCEHRSSTGNIFPGDLSVEEDIDYEAGFMSDGDIPDYQWSAPQRASSDLPFHGLTTRIGSHFSGINRWRNSRRPNLIASPTTEVSFENVLSQVTSSRSSSISGTTQSRSRSYDLSATTPQPTSYFQNADLQLHAEDSNRLGEQSDIERDRSQATTPLLPPLMNSALAAPPQPSPLQSPTVVSASTTTATEGQTSPPLSTYFPRPSLSSKPSLSSFRFGGSGSDLPLPLPSMMQDSSDEWSDRLGHANFTIIPQPYEPEFVAPETITKFREDWELAKVNYVKHLVRTGENYGQTSNIYGLTEAKWADVESRWRSIHDGMMRRQTVVLQSVPMSASNSRSQSRGRGRGRSRAGSASAHHRHVASADVSPDMHWPRLDDAAPNAITQMLDASGKFPNRGDEDIVGPMVRDEVMYRDGSEERKNNRFWKSLVDKVNLRK